MNRTDWMKGICLMWSRGRHFSPSLPGDRYLKLGSKSDHRAEISGNVVRYGALAFSLRMRSFLKLNFLLTICVGKSSQISSQLRNIFLGEGSVSQTSLNLTNPLRAPRHSLWIVATPRREATKLRNPPGFSYIENNCKNKLLKLNKRVAVWQLVRRDFREADPRLFNLCRIVTQWVDETLFEMFSAGLLLGIRYCLRMSSIWFSNLDESVSGEIKGLFKTWTSFWQRLKAF